MLTSDPIISCLFYLSSFNDQKQRFIYLLDCIRYFSIQILYDCVPIFRIFFNSGLRVVFFFASVDRFCILASILTSDPIVSFLFIEF